MAKKVIRLTENDLHRIVKESVNKILKEGQGWNIFKDRAKQVFNGEYDDEDPMSDKDYKKERNNFIKHGSVYDDDNYYHYYDSNGDPTHSNDYGEKKLNKGLSGRLGRRAGVYGVEGALKARQAYNKLRGKNG